jgi:hypothetical protein
MAVSRGHGYKVHTGSVFKKQSGNTVFVVNPLRAGKSEITFI